MESLASRDFMYYVTNLLLTLFAVAVAFGTVVVPLTMDRTVGPSTYNAIAQPLGVLTLLLIAVCPLLAWRRTEGAVLARLLILPGVCAALSAVLWLALGFGSSLWGFIGLVVCGFAAGAVVQFVLRSARRAAGPDASLWSGLGRGFSGSRSRTAAYFVHFGMVLVVAGLIGSNVYKVRAVGHRQGQAGRDDVGERLHPHVQRHADRHRTAELGGRDRALRRVPGRQHGGYRGAADRRLSGERSGGASRDPRRLEAGSVRGAPMSPSTRPPRTIALRMVVFPLIRFVWLGSILLCVGAAVSLWPKGQRQEQEVMAAALEGDAGDFGPASA